MAGEGGAKRRMRGRRTVDAAEKTLPLARSRARAMRRQPTDAERTLWRLLRDRRLSQTKWRRQVPLGPYIVDFVCFEHSVVVECDGSQHAENPGDAARDAWLTTQGFTVLRFWNHAVLKGAIDRNRHDPGPLRAALVTARPLIRRFAPPSPARGEGAQRPFVKKEIDAALHSR
jgi:very-short-patch-repair endonuclease